LNRMAATRSSVVEETAGKCGRCAGRNDPDRDRPTVTVMTVGPTPTRSCPAACWSRRKRRG
jgi:hypothetical protein